MYFCQELACLRIVISILLFMKIQKIDICIVGAGISGLALAAFLRKEQPQRSIMVLEKGARPGGAIRTYQGEGYMAEWGPHGFLDNRAESQELRWSEHAAHIRSVRGSIPCIATKSHSRDIWQDT